MNNPMSLLNRLSGLSLRSRFERSARSRRRRSCHRSPVAAEISLLEPRCLLSGKGLEGGHHAHEVTPQVQDFGPPGFSTDPKLVPFANYQWDTNWQYDNDNGFYQNRQQWAPQNVTVDGSGMHLMLKSATVTNPDNGEQYTAFSSAEAVLVATDNGTPFHPGYGTYLFSATTSGSFNRFAFNNGAQFGAFTYEQLRGNGNISGNQITGLPDSVLATLKKGMKVTGQLNYTTPVTLFFKSGTEIERIDGGTVYLNKGANGSWDNKTVYFTPKTVEGVSENPNRELDLTEVIQNLLNRKDTTTNSQFTLQQFWKDKDNVHRITLPQDQNSMTVVMDWTAGHKEVNFYEYNGTYTLANYKSATWAYHWKTVVGQNRFIPNSSNQTFHFNLWVNPNAKLGQPAPDEVTITNFQYQA
jgi:hypothetical protein